MKIAIDAMGGDHAPRAVVEGAILAAKERRIDLVLIGDEPLIRAELARHQFEGVTISVVHTDEVVGMDESPAIAMRKKKHASIKVAIEMMGKGEANAVVSAGNTGATLAASILVLHPIRGIDRPAIATLIPTLNGPSILLDVGANVDCKASQLFQFGIMGHVYARYILKKSRPRIGLLSIGEEDGKGNDATKKAFQLLKNTSLHFIGNVEGKEVFQGLADVVVCDGFTGNVALKIGEGFAEMFERILRDAFSQSLRTKFAYLLMKPFFRDFKKRLDYAEYGGAPLLGVNGICIIGHGRSSPKAIKNAIYLAEEFLRHDINLHIKQGVEQIMGEMQDGKFSKGTFWQHLKDTITFGPSREKVDGKEQVKNGSEERGDHEAKEPKELPRSDQKNLE